MKSARRVAAARLAWLLSLWGCTGAASDPPPEPDAAAAPEPDAASEPDADAASEPDAVAAPEPDAGALPLWLDDPEAPFPDLLSEVGLYGDLNTLTPAARALEYEPRYPLWSSDTDKQRLLVLPPGGHFDARFEAPVGTVISKTFIVPDGPPLETRLLVRRAAGWDYAVYLWELSSADARHLESPWIGLPLDAVRANGEALPYEVPSRLDCRGCHEVAEKKTGSPVLGITALQVEPALAAVAFDAPPAPAQVVGRTPIETEVLQYFVGNCIHCHHGGGGEGSAYSLYPEVAVERSVGVETDREGSEGTRVVAGDPEASILFTSVVYGRDPAWDDAFKPMPPIGALFSDPAAEPLLRTWIQDLP